MGAKYALSMKTVYQIVELLSILMKKDSSAMLVRKNVKLVAKIQPLAPHAQIKTASLAPHTYHPAAPNVSSTTKLKTGSVTFAKLAHTSTHHPKLV